MGIIIGCKAIQYICIFCAARVERVCVFCKNLKLPSNSISVDPGLEVTNKIDLSRFVLHLEGEENLVEVTMRKNCNATDHWMQKGKRRQPKLLIDLLRKANFAKGFEGVREFDCDQICSLEGEEPPHCWSLPIVTLTAIAVSLPGVGSCSVKQLIQSVHEGLMYVTLVEKHEDGKEELINIRRAANHVWSGVDIYHRWLDVDLGKLSLKAESTKEVLEGLAEAGKKRFEDLKKIYPSQCLRENPSVWHPKLLAANSMYRISSTILENFHRDNAESVIFCKCLKSTIEDRKASVREAVYLLGETEEIVKLLDRSALSVVYPDRITSISHWHSFQKLDKPPDIGTLSTMADIRLLSAGDICLTIG
ncbi:hypothetical protein LINGRAHAP2_LOCUS25327 [Linum grandiflorum]